MIILTGFINFCSKIVSTKPTKKDTPKQTKIFLIQGYCINYKLGLKNIYTPWLRRKYQLSRVTRFFGLVTIEHLVLQTVPIPAVLEICESSVN